MPDQNSETGSPMKHAPSATSSEFAPKSALPAWREVECLAHELLGRPSTEVPPASLVLTALGRGALVNEHTDDPQRRNYVDGKPLPLNLKFKAASVLSKKLADDIEIDARLRAGESYEQVYQEIHGKEFKQKAAYPRTTTPKSPTRTAPSFHPTQVPLTLSSSTIPTTTTIGVEIAFKKSHQIIHIDNAFSDGDAKLILPNGYITDTSAQRARKVLATEWMNSRGLAQPDTLYILDALPNHYVVASNPQKPQDRHNYVFGLPDGERFSSAAQFYHHFEHMALYGTTDGCKCKHCSTR